SELAKIEILRGNENIVVEVTPIIEAYTGKPKLGVKIKDRIYGVGTVTFVRGNGRFVALGHEICDSETGMHVPRNSR
ncbi:MAG: SpoIVB peptidase, partial [Clostridia bacterium]|nr:SpoIVB peptidase [Clostridia bacterium]